MTTGDWAMVFLAMAVWHLLAAGRTTTPAVPLAWIGKWVLLVCTHPVVVNNNIAGRLREINEEYVIVECGNVPYFVRRQHIVVASLAADQDHLTLLNMSYCEQNKKAAS